MQYPLFDNTPQTRTQVQILAGDDWQGQLHAIETDRKQITLINDDNLSNLYRSGASSCRRGIKFHTEQSSTHTRTVLDET